MCLVLVKMEPGNVKKALVSGTLLNRSQTGKYSFFRAFDILLLLGFSCFLIYCLTINGNVSVKRNAIANPFPFKATESPAENQVYFSRYDPYIR